MQKIDQTIVVTVEELTNSDDGEAVMTYTCYEKLAARKRIVKVVTGGGMGRCVLIDYASLPVRFRRRYEQKYGTPDELLRQSHGPAVVVSTAARRYFSGLEKDSYRLPGGECLPEEKIEEYTNNASVLDVLLAEVNTQRAGRNRYKNNTRICWENICATSEDLRTVIGHTLPSNPSRLREKIRTYEREGYASLVSRRFCNTCAVKIAPEGGRLMVAMRRSRTPVYSFEDILEAYNRRAEACNRRTGKPAWKPLQSVNAVKNYLNRPDVMPQWYAAVYGELAARQKFDRKQQTCMPSMRDALWYGDGTKLNLYYKGRDKDGRPVKMTTMVYEVIDAYSEMMLGYCICPVENAEAQRRAFRMAVETAGRKPFEIVTDNQGGQKSDASQNFMSGICRISRRTAPHTPQAKSIEALFGRFQEQVLRRDWRFTGQNITAVSPDSHPNLEFIGANIDSLYTYEELCEAYARYRQQWNDMPHPATGRSRREMYLESANAEAPELTAYDLIDLFWRETERPSEFTASGITIQVNNRRYKYEVLDEAGLPDMEFRRRNTGRKFYVKYDPDDMTRVWLCLKPSSGGTRMVVEAQPYVVVHRALQEQTPFDREFLRTTLEMNRQERVRRQAEGYSLELQHGMAPEQHGLRTPRLQGLSRREQERIYDLQISTAAAAPQDAEPASIGQAEKQLSNMTFDEASFINKF